MHRHCMHDDNYIAPCCAFAMGVMVGIVGSAKIRFLHKMHMQMNKNFSHTCCNDVHETNQV